MYKGKETVIKAIPVSLLLFIIIGCSHQDKEAAPSQTSGFGYLLYKSPIQRIIVQRVFSMDESTTEEGVKDAIVIVSHEEGSTLFKPVSDTPGLYIDTTGLSWVHPIEEYELLISTPYDDTLTGKTSVPDTFSILSPNEDDTIDLSGSSTLLWTKSDNSKIYIVHILSENTADSVSTTFAIEDISIAFSSISGKFKKSGWYIIKVHALDENAWRWEIFQNSTLTGGEGVFGSMTRESVRTYIIK